MKYADYRSRRVLNLVKQYRQSVKNIAAMDDVAAQVEAWLPQLEEFDPTFNVQHNSLNLGLYKIKNMNEVGKALRLARQGGYEYVDKDVMYHDNGGTRSWTLKKGDVRLSITANLSSDEDSSCHMVQVGIDTYPRYEIRCD